LFDRKPSLRPDLPLPKAVVSSGGQGWPSLCRRGTLDVIGAHCSYGSHGAGHRYCCPPGGHHYSTQYDYGQTGFVKVSDWVRQNTARDEVIMSMKDIGFATGRRYLENYLYVYGHASAVDRFDSLVERLGIRIFIFTERRGHDQLIAKSHLHAWVKRNTTNTTQIGDYVIYVKR
jgi:hypothetical protein